MQRAFVRAPAPRHAALLQRAGGARSMLAGIAPRRPRATRKPAARPSSSEAAMPMTPKHLFTLCRKAVMAWIDDFAPSMGAAISYYTIFSLAPLLVIVI